jgi:uncharacterized membrane protein YraQ (UPF0718 family)
VNKENVKESKDKKALGRMFIFPVCVLVIYGILFTIDPNKSLMALKASGNILRTISLPLVLVFVIMLALQLFIKPAQVVRLFGKDANIRGIALSMVAGIISMGPIYAWYPLLKNLREEGAETGLIAIFLYSRAVKPFLLPVMIAYFGWAYVVILTVLTVFAAIAIGYSMSIFMKEQDGLKN